MRLSQTGAFVGSLHYAAPEQLAGESADIDGRADLHALGLVLYELASGQHPYMDEDFRKVVVRVMKDEPRRVAEINPQPREGIDFNSLEMVRDAKVLIADDGIDLVVEVIGGVEPAKSFIEAALMNKKHVVTANKELIAARGAELIAAAERSGVPLLFEAAVGGGIPIIRPLSETLAGESVERVMGIVNGMSSSLAFIGIKVFPAVIVGGLDSVVGAVVGGLIIGLLENFAQFLDTEYLNWGNMYAIAPFYVLVIILVIRPYGLFGTADIERV